MGQGQLFCPRFLAEQLALLSTEIEKNSLGGKSGVQTGSWMYESGNQEKGLGWMESYDLLYA